MNAAEAVPPERRLHRWSWLFTLLVQLREFALPLLALLFFGRGGDWQEAAAAVAAVGLSLAAVVRYHTYRFSIGADELVIRSGLFQRTVRHLPFHRIQNVVLQQNPLHRWFGVAEVRLETAGNNEAEARMRVLALAEAEALEQLIRASHRQPAVAAPSADAPATDDDAAPNRRLLSIAPRDLVLLGLSANRGMVVVGAGLGLLWQIDPGGFGSNFGDAVSWLFATLGEWNRGAAFAATALALLIGASLLLRLLGVLVVLLKHYGFELREDGARLSTEGGLLSRQRQHVARARVQRWVIEQPWLLRRLQRQSLQVETAAGAADAHGEAGHALVPVALAEQMQSLLARWLPGYAPQTLHWHAIHPRAWRRWAFAPSVGLLLFCVAQTVIFGAKALPLFALLPLPILWARGHARFAGWAVQGSRVLWRQGWLGRSLHIIEIDRLQAIRLTQSPFDRRRGMASLTLDTAGAGGMRGVTELSFLPEAEARALAAELYRGFADPKACSAA